ncbi:MAG: PDGLE domain-containing protein, partial [Desulfuromonadales bacterium]
ITGCSPTSRRQTFGAIAGALLALQLGALAVVLQTVASGVSALPFQPFLFLMLPIHLAIGLAEGVVTALVISFVRRARPEILAAAAGVRPWRAVAPRRVMIILALAASVTAGFVSWFASTHPDGLEWSIAAVRGSAEIAAPEHGWHSFSARLQKHTALLPDYGFAVGAEAPDVDAGPSLPGPDSRAGTTAAGLVGGLLTLLLILAIGLGLKWRPRLRTEQAPQRD